MNAGSTVTRRRRTRRLNSASNSARNGRRYGLKSTSGWRAYKRCSYRCYRKLPRSKKTQWKWSISSARSKNQKTSRDRSYRACSPSDLSSQKAQTTGLSYSSTGCSPRSSITQRPGGTTLSHKSQTTTLSMPPSSEKFS